MPRLPDSTKAEIAYMYRQGKTYNQISKKFGVSHQTIALYRNFVEQTPTSQNGAVPHPSIGNIKVTLGEVEVSGPAAAVAAVLNVLLA